MADQQKHPAHPTGVTHVTHPTNVIQPTRTGTQDVKKADVNPKPETKMASLLKRFEGRRDKDGKHVKPAKVENLA